MAILEQVGGALSNILGSQKTNSVLGLDIGSSYMKVVQLRKKKDRAILETYGELALGPYLGQDLGRAINIKPEKMAEAARALFKEANITTKTGSVSVPLDSTLLSLITLPEMSEADLARTVPIEARKYIPVSLDEVSLDWWVIPKREEDKGGDERDAGQADAAEARQRTTEVLIVAIHNKELQKYNEIVKRVGLQNSSLEIEVFSAVRSTLSHDMAPFMVLDLGATSTKFSIVEQGIIKTSHILNTGSRDITKAVSQALNLTSEGAEERKREVGLLGEGASKAASDAMESTVAEIFAEANRAMLGYQTKFHRAVTKVVLVGGGALLKGFEQRAQQELATDVVYGDAFAKVEAPEFLKPTLKEAGPEFAVALGLALRQLQEIS